MIEWALIVQLIMAGSPPRTNVVVMPSREQCYAHAADIMKDIDTLPDGVIAAGSGCFLRQKELAPGEREAGKP